MTTRGLVDDRDRDQAQAAIATVAARYRFTAGAVRLRISGSHCAGAQR